MMRKTNRQRHSNIDMVLAVAVLATLAVTGPVAAADWTPADLDASSLTAWFDGADESTILTDGSGNVTNWLDKSGHGRNLRQTTVGYQPTKLAAGLNDLNVLDFDRDCMNSSGFVNTWNETFALIVFKTDVAQDSTGAGSARIANLTFSNNQRCYSGFGTFTESGKIACNFLNNPIQQLKSTFTYNTSWMIYGFGRSTTQGQIWKDGALNSSMSLSNALSVATQSIGVGGGSITDPTSFNLDGKIAEVVVFPSLHSAAIRQHTEGYLAHKWGLTGALPSNHPFKSTPPQAPKDFGPEAAPGLILWLDAGTGLARSGNTVTAWTNRVNVADNAVTDVGAPAYVAAAGNGRPAVEFSKTTSDSMYVPNFKTNFIHNTPFTVFMVTASPSLTFGLCPSGKQGSGPRCYLLRYQITYEQEGGASNPPVDGKFAMIQTGSVKGKLEVAAYRHNGNQVEAWRNGKHKGSDATGLMTNMHGDDNLYLSWWPQNNSGQWFELLWYKRALSDVEFDSVSEYLLDKYLRRGIVLIVQ